MPFKNIYILDDDDDANKGNYWFANLVVVPLVKSEAGPIHGGLRETKEMDSLPQIGR